MELSKNPYVYGLWAVLVVVVGVGVALHKLSAETAIAALIGLGLPSVLASKGGDK